jgi:transposase
MPGSRINSETRRIVVRLLTCFTIPEVATLAGISESSIRRIVKCYEETGELDLPKPDKSNCGRKPILDDEDREVRISKFTNIVVVLDPARYSYTNNM